MTSLPDDVVAFLELPQHAVLGWISEQGHPVSAATWYDLDGEEILLNMDARRRRLRSLVNGAPVSLTALDAENWYRHVSVLGEIVRIEPDPDLQAIDRLSRRYTGAPYRDRDHPRVCAWLTVRSWHGWIEGHYWPGSD
jgi:PPOX class probable F420-dependent enzyme